MRSILTVIPARSGSKGVRNKNIKLLDGKPLLTYAISAAKEAAETKKIIVSTDSEDIAKVAKVNGVEVPFIRPDDVATDSTTLILVAKHALKFFDSKGIYFDAVLSLQPTCPFVRSSTIDKVIQKFHNTGCLSVTTVSEMRTGHPYTSKRIVGAHEDMIKDFTPIPKGAIKYPRQKREPAFYFNGSMYLRDRKLIDEFSGHTLSLGNGKERRVVVMDEYESVDINTPLDLIVAEALIANNNMRAI